MTDHSGPAFPTQQPDAYEPGISVRDYMAAKAMRCVHAEYLAAGKAIERADYFDIAADAYTLADFMLKARSA